MAIDCEEVYPEGIMPYMSIRPITSSGMFRSCHLVVFIFMLTVAGGCVRRTITITSDPDGALVWLNDREVGRTPVDVDFLYYGTYDVRLEKPGYEPLFTSGVAAAPWWDTVPLDLISEVSPIDHHADVRWHYHLPPADPTRQTLIDRANVMRDSTTESP